MNPLHRSKFRVIAILLLAIASVPAWATIQSDAASRQSESNIAASVEVPVAVAHALSEGATFVVTAVDTSAEGVAVTVSATAVGASFVVHLSTEAAEEIGVVVSTAVSTTVIATGWLLSVAGEVLCFIANDGVRRHIHSRRID
ncbi:MAG TPA: hypothetical protein VIT22_08480 [Pseudoxanthomonas sp.]